MSWIVTPGQLSARAEFYYQLHQLQSAGIGLLDALESQRRAPASPLDRKPLGQVIARLREGGTFSEALTVTGTWVPGFDAALLYAGEQSGRLAECFRMLADIYRGRSAVLREMLSALMYPMFLIHFAVFLFPFATFFQTGDVLGYLRSVLVILGPLYVAVFVLVYAGQSRRSESWRSLMETCTRWIPILGKAKRNLALARLCAALEALVSAGVPLVEGWSLAACASGSPALRRVVAGFKSRLIAGETPADAVVRSGAFPDLFSNMYNTGEVTGNLDDTLKQLHRLYQEEGTRQVRALAQWFPKFVYLVVALFIAFKVVGFYRGYFERAF